MDNFDDVDLEIGIADRGLFALTWSSAILLLVPISVLHNGQFATVCAVAVSAVILQFQSRCSRRRSTFGMWFTMLQCSSLVALVSRSLGATLYFIDHLNGPSRLDNLFGGKTVTVLALVTVLAVSTLCSLGLERSGVLRWLLVTSVLLTMIMVVLNSDAIANIADIGSATNTTDTLAWNVSLVLKSSVQVIGSFITICDPRLQAFYQTAYSNTMLAIAAYVTVALSVYLMRKQHGAPSAVEDGTILVALAGAGWHRLAAIAVQVACLGLTLPELVVAATSSVLRLCGRLLPRWIGKEAHYTGTHVHAIVVSGLASSSLALMFCTRELAELYCAGHLCANLVDVVYTLYSKHQPSSYSRTENGSGGGARYEMLATNEMLDGSEEEEERLSEDSGHSSDTDIDAVVAEFKERIKVVANMSQPIITEPSEATGQRATVCLVVAVSCLVLTGLVIRFTATYTPCVLTLIVAVIALAVLGCQPAVPDELRCPLWRSGLAIATGALLLSHAAPVTVGAVCIYTVLGQILFCRYNPQRLPHQFQQLTQHVRMNAKRHRRPAGRRTSLVDTVHILR